MTPKTKPEGTKRKSVQVGLPLVGGTTLVGIPLRNTIDSLQRPAIGQLLTPETG